MSEAGITQGMPRNPPATRLLLTCSRYGPRRLFKLLSAILGIDLPYRLASTIYIPHPHGITISQLSQIGDGTVIYQGVTVGTKHPLGGTPKIGNSVFLGAGAIVIGEVTVGDNAVVAAGAVVVRDVPPGVTVAGNPARVVKQAASGNDGIDQTLGGMVD